MKKLPEAANTFARALCLVALQLTATLSFSQENAATDSINIAIDSLRVTAETSRVQSSQSKSEVDAPIDYEANEVDNLIEERLTILTGNAWVTYKKSKLEAGRITVDWNNNLLIAEPLPDSLRSASVKNGVADSAAKAELGYPVFSDGGDRLVGEKMEYNFATERGRVLRGRTEFEGGKYSGEQIKRVDEKVLNVSNGIYTTCEEEENPHFHFRSRRMKIIVNDKIIAKPIVFYFGKIPLAVLPFAWFPLQTGRHSGLIIPRYGQSTLEGRYIRGLGYYWAMNDYMDAQSTVDFYDRSGWVLNGDLRYRHNLHSFSGGIRGTFTRKNFVLNNSEQRFWNVAINHAQRLGQRSNLNVSGSFSSSNSFNSFFGTNRQEQLTRRINSNATYSTNFGSGSFSVNLSESKDLQNGSLQRTLPRVNLNFGQRQIFASQKKSKRKGGASAVAERPWYENLYYSYSSSGEYNISRSSDTSRAETRGRASHSLSFSLSNRYFGWLTLGQSLPITSEWFDRARSYYVIGQSGLAAPLEPVAENDPTPGSYDLDDRSQVEGPVRFPPAYETDYREVRGFFMRHLFSYSASASTTVYGTFQPRLGPVQALRHVVRPSFSLSFRPDFSDTEWGYYKEITLPDGTKQKFDRFGGSTSRGKQLSMGFALGNLFQMKTGAEDKPKKIDLFNLNFSSSYNFAAGDYKLAPLSTSLQANPTRNLNVSVSTSHSFYDYDRTTGRAVPRLLVDKNGWLSGNYMRLTNVNFYTTLRLEGKGASAGGGSPTSQSVPALEEDEPGLPDLRSPYENSYFTDTDLPWSVNLALNLNYELSNPLNKNRRAQLSLQQGRVALTKNWDLSISGQYDLLEKIIVDQQYSLHRNLHCWEMQLNWTPSGFRKGFYLRINIRAPNLQDIKIEKRGGRESAFGGFNEF
ncbi:LPS-assembly protein LptD [candidate division KSB1 bacterium]|nr:LPS-assembly protein LptD [candidate division KSB1 bacterium]